MAFYVLMTLVGVASFLLALAGTSRWISVGLVGFLPVVWVGFQMFWSNPVGIGESLLFVSPFLVAAFIQYSVIALLGSLLGRAVAKRYGKRG